jgi:HD-GYP domain-containing protein (c-di-GMP phosphodiesterase class II)
MQVMAQQEKQALLDVDAITPALQEVDGACPTLTDPAGPDDRPERPREVGTPSGARADCSEIGQAIDLLNNLASAVATIHRTARRRQSFDLPPLNQAIDALIETFACDPNALFWALAANRRMYYLSRRSVGCAVWALAIGYRLDFDRDALHELMLGALLLDLGKIDVPVVILAKAGGLNKPEQNFARRHVAKGVRILESVDGLSAATIEMVRSHHERIDGSGYPFGLKGDEISLYAQIAGIIDSFDALSLNRYYADGLSGDAALSMLREQRGVKFDSFLIDAFFDAIGEFPTGTWVEFADGRTGIVCSQDSAGQGGARVVLISDAQHQPILAVHWLSLHEHSEARSLPPAERPHHAAAMERSLQAAIYARRKKVLQPI